MHVTTTAGRRWTRWLACLAAATMLAAACGGDDGGDDVAEGDGTAEESGGDETAEGDEAEEDDAGASEEDDTAATEAAGEPVEGGSISVGLEAETNSWLPGEGAFATGGYNVGLAIYDPLMARGDDGELRPYLAETMEPNEDLTEWTMTLREGVTFHDGTDLTAEVIKTIFDEYLTTPEANTSGALGYVSEARVDGPLTVTYVLDTPNAAFPDLLQGPIGWPFSVEAAKAAGATAGSTPVGTGPFVFDSWQRDSRLVVTKSPDYWRDGMPYLDQITFRPIPDEDSRIQSLLSGDLQAMQTLRGSSIKQVLTAADSGGFSASQYSGNETGASILNVLVPPLDDVRIRTAFAHSSDAEAVAAVLGDDGLVEPSTQFFSTDSPWWSQAVADAYPAFDPEAGAALVEEYVNDPARSDGQPVGTTPVLDYNCPPDPSLLEVAQLVQAQLQVVGIEARLNQVEQAAHIANAIGSPASDPPFAGDYIVNCWRVGDQNDPATTLGNAFGDVASQPLNFTNFQTPELDALLEELATTVDFDDRYAIVEKIGILLNTQVPVTYGVGTPIVIGTTDTVKNVAGWTFPDGTLGEGHPSANVRWREVWVEQ